MRPGRCAGFIAPNQSIVPENLCNCCGASSRLVITTPAFKTISLGSPDQSIIALDSVIVAIFLHVYFSDVNVSLIVI